MFVFLGTNPLGAPMVGWLAQHFGPRMTIVLGGVVTVVVALAVAALSVPREAMRPALASGLAKSRSQLSERRAAFARNRA